jgi:hypothetical protein
MYGEMRSLTVYVSCIKASLDSSIFREVLGGIWCCWLMISGKLRVTVMEGAHGKWAYHEVDFESAHRKEIHMCILSLCSTHGEGFCIVPLVNILRGGIRDPHGLLLYPSCPQTGEFSKLGAIALKIELKEMGHTRHIKTINRWTQWSR